MNNASSPEEIDRLEQYLQMGKLPPNIDPHAKGEGHGETDEGRQ